MPNNEYIQRRIQRLDRKLTNLKALNNRFSWIRLGVFLFGSAATWTSAVIWGSVLASITLLVAVVGFFIVVSLHRRSDSWIEIFRIQQGLYREQSARLELDWDQIPLHAPDGVKNSELSMDLDLTGPHSLHHLLDTTISRQGSLLLAKWLTLGKPDLDLIDTNQGVVRELSISGRFRSRLAILFRRMKSEPLDAEKLLEWLNTPLAEKPLKRILPWVSILSATNAILFVLNAAGILPPYWILTMILYAGIYFANVSLIGEFLETVLHLDGELKTFQPLLRYLETYPYGRRINLERQCRLFLVKESRPSERLRQLRIVTAMAGVRMNQILGFMINAVTPWDFWVAWLALNQKKHMANLLPGWLDAFHQLEALISLGEFAALHPDYSYPKFSAGDQRVQPVFQAGGLGHPLLKSNQKVRNDLLIDDLGTIIIITGSNMSGKSTFLRTVGINLCLAYAGSPVDAENFEALPFRLFTCIRISDSLDDGFSYFYSEVKRLKGLLDSIKDTTKGQPLLYLIDEIFRGTNNRERLIGSQAFVKSLVGEAGIGLVATHDLELAGLADTMPQARNMHFGDQIARGKLIFDYRLHHGPSTTTNALKIMEIEGLPLDNETQIIN